MRQSLLTWIMRCSLAALLWLAVPAICQTTTTLEYDDTLQYYDNPVARFGIPVGTADATASLLDNFSFGTNQGDPTRPEDDMLAFVYQTQAWMYIETGNTQDEIEIGDETGKIIEGPLYDTKTQTWSYTWKADPTVADYTVQVKYRVIRDIVKWSFALTSNMPRTMRVGFRILFNMDFGDVKTGPYYITGSRALSQSHEYKDAAVPAEWFIRYTPSNLAKTASSPVMRFRCSCIRSDITTPERVVFASYDEVAGYTWPIILQAEAPGAPPDTDTGIEWGASTDPTVNKDYDLAMGHYYSVLPLAYHQTRTISGEYRLDWAAENTVSNQYALAVQTPEFVNYIAGDDPTTVEVEHGYFDPKVFNVNAYLFNASQYITPIGNVAINLGSGLVLSPVNQTQAAKSITGQTTDFKYTWTVKVDPLTCSGGNVPITVTANLNPGGSVSTTAYINVPSLPQLPPSLLNQGYKYQFVGFPFTFTDKNAFTILSNVQQAAIASAHKGIQVSWWNPAISDYKSATSLNDQLTLEAGRGYWLMLPTGFSSTSAQSLNGATALNQTVTQSVQLTRGWNAISNPYQFSIIWGYCYAYRDGETITLPQAVNKGWIRRELWSWDPTVNEYMAPINPSFNTNLYQELKPYQGYWLYVSQSCYLVFAPNPFLTIMGGYAPSKTATSAKQRTPGSPDNWQVNLIVETANGRDSRTAFGVGADDLDGVSKGDVMKPPVGPTGISAYFPRSSWGEQAGNYATDLQAPGASKSWTLDVLCAQPNQQVVLRWPDLSQVPADLPLVLTDDATGQRLVMRTAPSYTFNSGAGGIRRLTISAGGVVPRLLFTSTQAQKAGRGAGASIVCGLTMPAQVTIRLRTLGGRLVRTLGPVDVTGQQAILWDGLDDHGRRLPVGAYIGELYAEATDGQRIRANLLITTQD